jgi:hypothetical protein
VILCQINDKIHNPIAPWVLSGGTSVEFEVCRNRKDCTERKKNQIKEEFCGHTLPQA